MDENVPANPLATNPAPDEAGGMAQPPRLTPMKFPEGYVPGRYAPWYCSPAPIFGPDELGEYAKAIEEMDGRVTKSDDAARRWEVLQAWEARFMRRNYQFSTIGARGALSMYAASSGTNAASILQTQNTMKLFSCNVYGQRGKKITALLSRKIPSISVVAENEKDSIDSAAREEAEKYLRVFENHADLKGTVAQIANYFYTDDRVATLTYTIADQTRWGTEIPDRKQEVYGAPQSEGVSPETEMDPSAHGIEELPARREAVMVLGKLEHKVPMLANHEHEMGWWRGAWEAGNNLLKAKYPWIRLKITAGGKSGESDQFDRMARMSVRLAVQSSSSSGDSARSDATESVTFYRPSEFESITDEAMREMFYREFPDGLEVWHAAGVLAFCRNGRMSDHVKIAHPAPGDGQNREAMGTNYLPLQKVLNANISLADRYFRSAVPRRFVLEPYIDSETMNSQSNDPAKATPVFGIEGKNLTIDQLTGLEKVPQPNDSLFTFIQWLIEGAPEAMDGGTGAAFGENGSDQDEGVFKTTRLRRDQALQVFSMPWAAICDTVSTICLQAIESAAANRQANISASLPGQQKLEIEIERLQGSVLTHPESLDIPRTLAEEEENMSLLLEQSGQVALYQKIMNDPANLPIFARMPTLKGPGLKIDGADAAEQQQGEFEILTKSGPLDNPRVLEIEEHIQSGEQEIANLTEAAMAGDPAVQMQLEQTEQVLQQLQQALQKIPPQVSTVQVAQDTSQNHAIHAAITLGLMTSPTGRKLKYGNDEQKAIFANLELHWKEHVDMAQKLTPPREIEMKGTVSVDPTKLPPEAQAKAFQAIGLDVSPQELTPIDQTHEMKVTREGIGADGVPMKQEISIAGKPLR